MTNSELFKIGHIIKDDVFYLTFEFSNIARYTTKPLLTSEIPLDDFMKATEAIMKYFKDGEPIELSKDSLISIELTKTTAKIISRDHYFSVKKKHLFPIFVRKVEELYQFGVISFK